MQDMIVSVVAPFEEPIPQANFVVFKNDLPAVPMKDGGNYFKKCKQYAKQHNTYLVTELMNIGDFLCLCMFDPAGKIAGAQRGLFLSRENRTFYKKPANLALFDTPYGKVFLCVDSDIYMPEVQRTARLGGCEIVVCSQWFGPGEYNEQRLFTGCWGAAQTNNLIVIAASNCAGAICAPFLATTDNTGYLARPSSGVTATFNVSRLSGIHSDYHSSHFNKKLFAAHRSAL